MFHAKNGQLKLEETSVDYIRFGTGVKYLILIPGVGDGLRTVRGSALPFSFLYRMFAKEYTVFASAGRTIFRKPTPPNRWRTISPVHGPAADSKSGPWSAYRRAG